MNFREVFKREYQRVGSTTAVPERVDGLIELVHQRETGQYESHTFRLLQHETHVFYEVLAEKSRFEVALQNSRRQIVQGPAGGCAAADGVQHPVQIEACL